MLLVSPATYLSLSQFQAEANDCDLSSYTDDQLTDMLVRASGMADSIMGRTYLPTEVSELHDGSGTNSLNLGVWPIAYLKRVTLVFPGSAPFDLPIGALLVDAARGRIQSYQPLIFQSLGVSATFPKNDLPINVQFAYGFALSIPAPAFTVTDSANGTLTPGAALDVQVTSATQSGESIPSAILAFTPIGPGVTVNITPRPGAFLYRVYAALHGGQTMLVAESPATNYGTATIPVSMASLSAPPSIPASAPPTIDNSAWPQPAAFGEAVRLLTLSMIYEQNNLANRGVYVTQSGQKRMTYISTEGRSGKGTSTMVSQAQKILRPYMFSGIF